MEDYMQKCRLNYHLPHCQTFSWNQLWRREAKKLHRFILLIFLPSVLEINPTYLPSSICRSRLIGVAKVAGSLTDSQSILTYYILYTTSQRQTNRTSKIHLLLWFVDILWKITLQHYLADWKKTLFIQPAYFNTGSFHRKVKKKSPVYTCILQDCWILNYPIITKHTVSL